MAGNLFGTSKLPSLDNLFGEADVSVVEIPISQLYPFKDHPFSVRDDDEMNDLVESISKFGINTPANVRMRPEGGYELISGHRRHRACEFAHLETMPCIIRDWDDDTAIIQMVDSNCQREHIPPTEKGKALKMKLEAIKRKSGRPLKINPSQLDQNLFEPYSIQKVADDAKLSVKQAQRYIRLTNLIPELQEMVDADKLKLTPAVEISFMTPEEQKEFHEYIDTEGCTPSLSQAQRLKAASRETGVTMDEVQRIMTSQPPSVKPREQQISIPLSRVETFLPKSYTPERTADLLVKLLENYFRNRHRSER